MKTCNACGVEREGSGFYADRRNRNGLGSECKACVLERRARYRATSEGREYHRLESRKYRATRKDQRRRTLKSWEERNPEKRKAQYALNNAVKSGRIVRQPCLVCDDPRSHGHHANGYNDPLDVVWLCALHHKQAHTRKDV